MTPEGKIKQMVKDWCKEVGAYYFMPVQSGYGQKTLDFLICYKGKFIAIETKAPGKKPTKFQELTLREIEGAAGIVKIIDSEAAMQQFSLDMSYF